MQPCSWLAAGKNLSSGELNLFSHHFVHSYISDITANESRTSRMSFLYAAITISFPAGLFASIYLYQYGGYLAIWGTSLGLALSALLYTIFFITDSRGQKSELGINDDGSDQATTVTPSDTSDNIFSNIWGCLVTTFQSRPGYKRLTVILLLAGMTTFVFSQGFHHKFLTFHVTIDHIIWLLQWPAASLISMFARSSPGTNRNTPLIRHLWAPSLDWVPERTRRFLGPRNWFHSFIGKWQEAFFYCRYSAHISKLLIVHWGSWP